MLASERVTRLLVVDDDANLRHTLGYAFRQEGFEVVSAADGDAALTTFRQAHPDLVVLDVMLPGRDGFEVCRALRRESDVPVIMLTARDTELDKVVGLEIGADDYLAKPFSTRELVARVRAMLRRSRRVEPARTDTRIEIDGLVLDGSRHRVTLSGRAIELKPKEFDLLAFFMGHAGQVFGREQLLASVWGYDFAGDSRTVDTHVKSLREKLGDSAERPRWIETVRGVGYRFRERVLA
jgi:DNA-binding response OmpR family regulator